MNFFSSFAVRAEINLLIVLLRMTVVVDSEEPVHIREVGRLKSQVICQGKSFKMKCDNSSLAISVYNAKYGRLVQGRVVCPFNQSVQQSVILADDTDDSSDYASNCGLFDNATMYVARLCHKKKRCVVTANETYLGNPCKGVYKYLDIIYSCEVKNKIRTLTYTLHTNPTKHTFPHTTPPKYKPTTSTVRSTRTKPKVKTTRKKFNTLTKRKKNLGNSTVRKKPRNTKAPKVTTISTSLKTTKKPTTKSKSPTSIVRLKPTSSSGKVLTYKTLTPTTETLISKTPYTPFGTYKLYTVRENVTTATADTTLLISDVSSPVTPTVVSTTVTITTERNKTVKTLNTSTGIPVNSTIPSQPVNSTIPSTRTRTRTTTVTTQTSPSQETRTPLEVVASDRERREISLGFTGSLYLWFLHMKENPSAYLMVFLLSAFGTVAMMAAGAACYCTLQKKKEFLKHDIIHKPRRFIAAPKQEKKTNQNGHVPDKDYKFQDGEDLPDGMILQKGPEVIFTSRDVNYQVTKEFNINRYSHLENGALKGDEQGVHINLLFNSNTSNRVSGATVSQQVSSGPPTPARSRNLSDPRVEPSRRARCNSTGNVSRSHDRRHVHGTSHSPENHARLPRHLSAGNVSQCRQGAHVDRNSPNQSPVKTLPRASAGSGIRYFGPPHWRSTGTTTAHPQPASVPQTLMRNVPGTLSRSHAQAPEVKRQLSSSNSPQYDSRDQTDRQYEYRSKDPDGDPVMPDTQDYLYRQRKPSVSAVDYSLANEALDQRDDMKSSTYDDGSFAPYSTQQVSPKLKRKWSREKPVNTTTPNITTNPFHTPDSRDIWQKQQDPRPSPHSRVETESTPENILHTRIWSDPSSSPETGTDKGTMRTFSSGELLSPLDAITEGNGNTQGLRFSDQDFNNLNSGTSSFHPFPPPPPELLTDSSDDDLYSIVAKGTYSSAAPDPNLRHSPELDSADDGRGRTNTNQHVSVVISSVE